MPDREITRLRFYDKDGVLRFLIVDNQIMKFPNSTILSLVGIEEIQKEGDVVLLKDYIHKDDLRYYEPLTPKP